MHYRKYRSTTVATISQIMWEARTSKEGFTMDVVNLRFFRLWIVPIYSMGWTINSQLFCLLHRLGGIFTERQVPTFFGCCLGKLSPLKWYSRCPDRGPIMPSNLEVRTSLALLLLAYFSLFGFADCWGKRSRQPHHTVTSWQIMDKTRWNQFGCSLTPGTAAGGG